MWVRAGSGMSWESRRGTGRSSSEEERGFKVKGSEELEYAVKLIKQAYNLAEV